MAGEVRDGEDEIAELLLHPVGVGGPVALPRGDLGLELLKLLPDLLHRAVCVLPVEADACGLLLRALGLQKRGKRGGNAVERRVARLLLVLHLLDLLPVPEHRRGILRVDVAEDMRMAVDELVGNRVRNVIKGEAPLLLGHDALEHDLEENVAKFLDVVGLVLRAVHRRKQLVRLFEKARLQRLERLLAVPGTALLGVPEASHYVVKSLDAGHVRP